MRRKVISCAALLCCTLALVSCGGGGNGTDASNGGDNGANASQAVADQYDVAAASLSIGAPGVLTNDNLAGGVDIVSYTQGNYGIVTLNNNGSFTYQPSAGYSGSDTFSYTIRDVRGRTSTAQVNLKVTAPGDSSAKIAEAVDLSQAQIAKYKDNRLAAASYTFDDALSTQFQIADYFEEVGLRASFFLVPTNIPEDSWQDWRSLANQGHELGNHSMNHIDLSNPALSDADLDLEINGAQQLIAEKTGVRPSAFVFPAGRYNGPSLSVALQHHLATRVPGFPSDYQETTIGESITAADQANAILMGALNDGKWIVFAGHGLVNGGQKGEGWSPILPQVLHDHLLFASTQTESIWIDTFTKVARYRLCRDQVQPKTEQIESNLAKVRFDGNYPDCIEPLTVILPIKNWPAAGFYARTASGENVPHAYSGNFLLLNVIPGKEVLLSIAQ